MGKKKNVKFLLFDKQDVNAWIERGDKKYSIKCLQVLKKNCTFASLLKTEATGRLAQLVQSVCLTSRGSAVRIRQRPPVNERFRIRRALSSAGSERLPYKQRVGGSNPSAPTLKRG